MARDFSNLLEMDFVPLTEIKAKLSEFVRKMVARSHRLTITTNGKPTAVLLPYSDFLELLRQRSTPIANETEEIMDIKDWRRGRAKRVEISRYIDGLFNPGQLSRKGQKGYKQERVRGFDR
jgi:prevent-host-death family protein